MERIKLGVFGLIRGCFALNAAKLLPDEAVVTAVCDFDKSVFNDYTTSFFTEETKIYETYDELIHSGIDAVILCNYFHEHAKYAIAALEAGVAVLSETTAAVSLGECVDLVEAVERTGGKYMLGANCLYIKPVHAIKKLVEEEKYGKVCYADAEYVHGKTKGEVISGTGVEVDYDHLHWRQTLPATYYNMHSLGPLMYVTNSIPKKVVGKVVKAHTAPTTKISDGVKSFVLTEMDNGAVFNTTGCNSVGTTGKWFRVVGEYGTMETPRFDGNDGGLTKLIEVGSDTHEIKTTNYTWSSCNAFSEEEEKKYSEAIDGAGHGGIDLLLFVHFIKYLRGEEEAFFDVYRSTALSAAGILAWYSVLSGSKEMIIPDFKNKAERDAVRGDYRKPFAEKYSDITLPCKVGDTLPPL